MLCSKTQHSAEKKQVLCILFSVSRLTGATENQKYNPGFVLVCCALFLQYSDKIHRDTTQKPGRAKKPLYLKYTATPRYYSAGNITNRGTTPAGVVNPLWRGGAVLVPANSAGTQFSGVVVGGYGTQYTAPRFPGTEKRHGHTKTHCSYTGEPGVVVLSFLVVATQRRAKKRVLVGFVRLWFPVPGFHGVPRGRQN